MFRHDFIKRFIEQMAAFLARLSGFVSAGKLEEADREVQNLERELGLPRDYERLDARSLALLLGQADKAALAALLLWHRAEIATERGQVAEAARLQARARELYGVIPRDELSRAALELLATRPFRQEP